MTNGLINICRFRTSSDSVQISRDSICSFISSCDRSESHTEFVPMHIFFTEQVKAIVKVDIKLEYMGIYKTA